MHVRVRVAKVPHCESNEVSAMLERFVGESKRRKCGWGGEKERRGKGEEGGGGAGDNEGTTRGE
jgi:hypothetical protein